jgi:hypothetical protein
MKPGVARPRAVQFEIHAAEPARLIVLYTKMKDNEGNILGVMQHHPQAK